MEFFSAEWQSVINYFAAYGADFWSNSYIAKKCGTNEKIVKAIKKQLGAEERGWLALFSIREEISRIQSIPRCGMCGCPLSSGITEWVTSTNDSGYKHRKEVHTACVENSIETMNWKIALLRNALKKVS